MECHRCDEPIATVSVAHDVFTLFTLEGVATRDRVGFKAGSLGFDQEPYRAQGINARTRDFS